MQMEDFLDDLVIIGIDRYGRTVAMVLVNGSNLSKQIVHMELL